VTPSGRAPVMATLRAASATLIAAPSHGSMALSAWFASVEATSAFVLPLILTTAAPWPGPSTVFAWTVESYCSKTGCRLARFAEPSSATSTAPGSIPRSGSPSEAVAGAPGAGAARRRVGGDATRSWTIASLVRAAAGMRASSRPPPATTVMSPSSVTVPITAAGRPHRSQTARTSGHRSGSTIASIRSCDSLIITSKGSMPGSRRGIASSSIRIPVPALSAVSEVAQVTPPAPRSWSPTTSRPRIRSSDASMRSFSANGSPT
jgi:hypothetical protein